MGILFDGASGISASGNITAGYLFGDGNNITGVTGQAPALGHTSPARTRRPHRGPGSQTKIITRADPGYIVAHHYIYQDLPNETHTHSHTSPGPKGRLLLRTQPVRKHQTGPQT